MIPMKPICRKDWYQVDLSLEDVREDAALFELQRDAWELFSSSGEPPRMAVFARNQYKKNKLPVFFSPD